MLGKMFLIVLDAYSKWMEVEIVTSATTEATANKLRPMFATHGLPEILVSDNGSTFTSQLFQEFLKRNGIRHIQTAPYHPASNGQAEQTVQTFEEALKRSPRNDSKANVSRFLFQYRTTPHSTTGVTPAELLMASS